jgi:membrane-bound lytic murein transglycosylase MltF
LSTLDDLAGKEVFVRKSSSYYESLVTLNTRFAAENKPLIKLKDAPEELEDEDLIQMLNAGLVSILELFRKYGDRYDVDWLLMAAQGYQESKLDQQARSHVGAIGVMQVMPATGKELNVGDVTQLDPNIHARVKYMRFMIDRYYENEPMTKLDKALFTFASYNAGPGRVAQLRKEAAKRGYNPNVWFHNVEYIAEEKIGHETVTYVSNIFKYYVAYRLIGDALEERRGVRESQER